MFHLCQYEYKHINGFTSATFILIILLKEEDYNLKDSEGSYIITSRLSLSMGKQRPYYIALISIPKYH